MDLVAIQSLLLDTPSLTIPRLSIPSGPTLEFRLSVTNRAGGVSTTETQLVTKAAKPVLIVSFQGGITSLTSTRPKRVSLIASVALPQLTCVSDVSTDGMLVDFGWTVCVVGVASCVANTRPSGSVVLKGGKELVFPSGTLSAGVEYLVNVTAAPIGDVAATILPGYSVLTLKVARSPLTVGIVGGAARSAGCVSRASRQCKREL